MKGLQTSLLEFIQWIWVHSSNFLCDSCYKIIVLLTGKPRIEHLSFDRYQQTLNCTSAFGPATDVVWMRNERKLNIDGATYQQLQTITNRSESSYVNMLYIHKRNPADVAGNYSCTIRNIRGHATQNLEVQGEKCCTWLSELNFQKLCVYTHVCRYSHYWTRVCLPTRNVSFSKLHNRSRC